jgi:hypothetical protein
MTVLSLGHINRGIYVSAKTLRENYAQPSLSVCVAMCRDQNSRQLSLGSRSPGDSIC